MNIRILLLSALCGAHFAVHAHANDSFNNPADLSPAGGMLTGSTILATAELGEVGISSYAYGSSVWFRLITPNDLRFNAKTEGSHFDTTLALYRGASMSEARLIAVNDDVEFSAGNLESEVLFGVSTGVIYHVRLAARSFTYGSTKLVVAPAKVTGTSNFDAAFGGLWWNPLPPV